MNNIKKAQDLLKEEANCLINLAENLDNEFSNVINSILKSSGRIIIIGIGKSGHIGAKIAATLASTGTPSFFAHPAELTHGDLGMITEQDICILISNSGETAEIINVIPHLLHRHIQTVAITAKNNSTLAKQCDYSLCTHITQEAGFLNLAPTSSTTATLALGDALALVLMENRHFTPEDFVKFHPGGSLGKKLVRVNSLMINELKNLPLATPETKLLDLLETINAYKLGLVIIQDNNKCLNIITDGDLRRYQIEYKEKLFSMTASELIKNKQPNLFINSDELAFKALEIMNTKKISSLVVLDVNNNISGLVTIQHILSAGITP